MSTEQDRAVISLSQDITQLLKDSFDMVNAGGEGFYILTRAMAMAFGELAAMSGKSGEDLEGYVQLVASIMLEDAREEAEERDRLREESEKLKQIVKERVEAFEAAIIGKPEAQA
jgi:hypothetical protein